MAVAVYTSDLTTLIPDDTTSLSNWAAIGGGASGLNIETDYFIQGSSCTSKNAFASATKGLVEDTTNTALTSGDLDAIYMWITHLTPGSLDTKANGGLALVAGSASNTLNRYNYAGSDTVDYGAPWICAVVDPENATASSGTVTPANMDTYGVEAKLVGGPTKGAPLGVDAIRQGRSYDITAGDVATPGTFTEAATKNDLQANRYGQFQGVTGGFSMQCHLGFGTVATACYFKDSNVSITLPDLEFVDPGFNEFEVVNSGSTLIWTNVTITALGTNAKGNFLVTASTLVEHTACTFVNMGDFTYSAAATSEGCVHRNTGPITLNGGQLTALKAESFYGWDGPLASLGGTITETTSVTISGSQLRGVEFYPGGFTVVTIDISGNLKESTLSVAFDLTSTVTTPGSATYDTSPTTGSVHAFDFSTDGYAFFVLSDNDILYEFSVSVAFDLSSTVAYTGNSYDTNQTASTCFKIIDEGNKFFVVGSVDVEEFSLSIPYDITSTVTKENTYIVSSMSAVDFNDLTNKMYLTQAGTALKEYDLGANPRAQVVTDDLDKLSGCVFTVSGGGYVVEIPTEITVDDAMGWDCVVTGGAVIDGVTGAETILCNVASGITLTINVSDTGSTPTIHNTGLGAVTVVTGQKIFSFTVSPNITGYEWRLYVKDPIDGIIGTVELDGEEVATQDNQSYSYEYISDRDVVLQIIAADYEESLTLLTLSNADQSLTVNLSLEENT